MIEEQAITRFNEMIILGKKVLSTRRSPPQNVFTSDFVDVQIANQWFTSSLSLIGRVFGQNSEHYLAMKRHFKEHIKYPDVEYAYGVLLASLDDLQNGGLYEVKTLITAEIFDNFLEQGEALLSAGYFAPAAVVIGAVLEDGLRKLCFKNNIEISEKSKLDFMNGALAKAGIYNLLTQKKITALADIRNSAAHGKWSELNSSDIEGMLIWTREFMEKYFS
jgi:hypothetical protein